MKNSEFRMDIFLRGCLCFIRNMHVNISQEIGKFGKTLFELKEYNWLLA